jgi:hypothetical protein
MLEWITKSCGNQEMIRLSVLARQARGVLHLCYRVGDQFFKAEILERELPSPLRSALIQQIGRLAWQRRHCPQAGGYIAIRGTDLE